MFPYVRYGQEETVRKGKTPKVVQGASACITKYKITEAHKVPRAESEQRTKKMGSTVDPCSKLIRVKSRLDPSAVREKH
jgi:hypothetical protein